MCVGRVSLCQTNIVCASPESTLEKQWLSLCADIAVLSACPLKKFYKPARDMESMKVCKIL